ncbi:hypothetical protein GCM10020001_087900 [Nonomuraea salmonea]
MPKGAWPKQMPSWESNTANSGVTPHPTLGHGVERGGGDRSGARDAVVVGPHDRDPGDAEWAETARFVLCRTGDGLVEHRTPPRDPE